MIRARDISKRYMMYSRPLDRLWDWIGADRQPRGKPFWALRGINFEVQRGTSMGIVGVNGAGKSTLLKILTGTTRPTEGAFEVHGRVSSLLELGTGFHPEFTGRQNIEFSGRMAGLTEDQISERFDSIVEFSELGDFIDQPVRTYSSGMALRLGFAIASSVDPDVLMVDEALAVGDLHFQHKCLARIRQFHERGVTVLFVSHDPSLIKKFCNEAILLDAGKLIERGKPDQVLDYYTALLAEKYRGNGSKARIIKPAPSAVPPSGGTPATADSNAASSSPAAADSPPPLNPRGHRTGNFSAVITSVWLADEEGRAIGSLVTCGQWVQLCIRFVALDTIPEATVGIALKDRLGQEIYGTNTYNLDQPIGSIKPGRRAEVRFEMPMNLGEGLYSVTAAVHTGPAHTIDCFDWVEQALEFQVLPDPAEKFTGFCRLGAKASVQMSQAGESEKQQAQSVRQ
ncbi:ABC transporter ATP-binding protein [bacterium]|nr:ABC transporter ATP-binding protein [bacterium]